MKRSICRSVAAVMAALMFVMLPLLAKAEGDPARGATLGATCLGCHGVPGYRNAYPSYRVPMLGGQKPAYIKSALEAYAQGTRPHPTMRAQGSALSDQDIADIAAWIGSSSTARDEVSANDVANLEPAQQCIACHSQAGVNVTPAPPVLSGQHRDYLEHALERYREQARGMTVMNAFAAALSDEDIEQLAAFYSSQSGLYTLGTGVETAPE